MYIFFNKYCIIILLILIINSQYCNSSIISREGDSIFSFFSDLVYDSNNYTQQYQFVSINGECTEWMVKIDTNRMMVFESRLSNNLIISFKGTEGISDVISDLSIMPVDCTFNSNCGKVHNGFLKEYNEISSTLLSVINSIDQSYDVYFTGHSLGGALALLSALDYVEKQIQTRQHIKSLHCITFGQPGLGDNQFSAFLVNNSNKFTYRRYVNINNNTAKFQQDPIPNSIFPHPTNPIFLNCNGNNCPLFELGLHFLDLYGSNVFNSHFTQCSTNCKFIENDAKFMRFKQYHCPISIKSLVSGNFNPKGWFPDKYSVCLFNSKSQFSKYSYKASTSCNLISGQPDSSILLFDKSNKPNSFSKTIGGDDLYIIVENHNTILSTSNFEYNVSFTNPTVTPKAPYNLTAVEVNENNDTMTISISFNSDNQNILPLNTQLSYNVYVSEIGKDWKKYIFVEPSKTKFITNKLIQNIPKSFYSVIVTANVFDNNNGMESHSSNNFFIYCKSCNNTQFNVNSNQF